jgi:predicted NBD/HSP70 family sugar kinase
MTSGAAIPPLLKDLNQRAVLETIRDGAPISRAEISRRARISKPTVSLALQSLVDAGLVREAAEGPRGPRYGATYFEPVDEAALVLGVDVGARFLRGALCDLEGHVLSRFDVPLRAHDAASAVEAIADLRDALVSMTRLPPELIDAAVIGVPGVVNAETRRVQLTSVAGLDRPDFAAELESRLGLPVLFENDINLAALGEQWQGVARGVSDFAFMSIGTGLGVGIVLRDELLRGHNGAAGELDYAHAGLSTNVDPCAAAVSAFAARLAAETAAEHELTPPFEVRAIFAAARGGDALARIVVDEVARRIALHVVPIASVADVELVVLGGGLGANGDLLVEPVQSLLAQWVPYPPRVEVSSLGEAAVLTGALSIGLRAALENVFVGRARRTAEQA